MEYSIDIDDVFAAAGRLDGIVKRTPVVSAEGSDKVAGRQVLLKCENLQYVGAFKFRGATNAVIMLGDAAENGVCTHSSGNHAQALSMAAKNRGVDEKTAHKIFSKINGHYMFPESHSHAFAISAYQVAWLKYHYPLEFYVSLMNNQPMGFYPIDSIKHDAKNF